MNKFQKGIRFGDLDEFLEYLPEDQRQITEALRGIVLSTIPDLKEKLSYNVPFYSKNGRIAFIWPSAIPWGGTQGNGVMLGFARGAQLSDPEGHFAGQDTKEIRKCIFTKMAELNADWIRAYLLEAAALDEELRKKK